MGFPQNRYYDFQSVGCNPGSATCDVEPTWWIVSSTWITRDGNEDAINMTMAMFFFAVVMTHCQILMAMIALHDGPCCWDSPLRLSLCWVHMQHGVPQVDHISMVPPSSSPLPSSSTVVLCFLRFWIDKDDLLDSFSRLSLLGVGIVGVFASQTTNAGAGNTPSSQLLLNLYRHHHHHLFVYSRLCTGIQHSYHRRSNCRCLDGDHELAPGIGGLGKLS